MPSGCGKLKSTICLEHNLGRESLNESKKALEDALLHLEATRMTPPHDPALTALKDDIRRSIGKPRIGKQKKRGKTSR